MNKQNVGNFLLPLVATRQVRQGGYLHKNIFDVLHLHQSEGRKYFIRYLKIIIESRGKNYNTSGKTLYRK